MHTLLRNQQDKLAKKNESTLNLLLAVSFVDFYSLHLAYHLDIADRTYIE